jgi:hypothetical protein
LKKSLTEYILCLLLIVSVHEPLGSQVLRDTSSLILVKQGVEYIYNYQFDKATEIYEIINAKFPDHPLSHLFHGMITYWKHFPLVPSSPQVPSFRNDMLACIDLCEKKRLQPGEPEYLLADIGARGLLLLFYADNGLSSEVIPLASRTYQDVMRSFDYTGLYADFYFVTGLYKYYRETYPRVHPIYNAFTLLFPKGNSLEGLAELKIAAQKAIFLKAEANTFLSGIFIGYENDFQSAYQYSKALFGQFPGNNEFLANYIKNLLLMKQYDEAEKILAQNRNPESPYARLQKQIFQAIILEKKYHDPDQAEYLYHAGIKETEEIGEYANGYLSFSYFGLSRIMKSKGDTRQSRYYYKKALDLATYKQITFDD